MLQIRFQRQIVQKKKRQCFKVQKGVEFKFGCSQKQTSKGNLEGGRYKEKTASGI